MLRGVTYARWCGGAARSRLGRLGSDMVVAELRQCMYVARRAVTLLENAQRPSCSVYGPDVTQQRTLNAKQDKVSQTAMQNMFAMVYPAALNARNPSIVEVSPTVVRQCRPRRRIKPARRQSRRSELRFGREWSSEEKIGVADVNTKRWRHVANNEGYIQCRITE